MHPFLLSDIARQHHAELLKNMDRPPVRRRSFTATAKSAVAKRLARRARAA